MAKRDAKRPETAPSGRFAYQGLDRSIHERARLGIMTSLLTHPEGVSFNDLKQLCELTDGNLSRHLEVLHEGGLVTLLKQPGPGRSTTICCLTASGRASFLEYLEELHRVIADASEAAGTQPSVAPRLNWSAGG